VGFWTLAGHPDSYRVLDSVLEQDESWWRVNDRHVARGDRVAIYKYKGRDAVRGVVALGEVVTDPAMMEIPLAAEPYALDSPRRRRLLPDRAVRVRVRYANAPRLPLWADQRDGSVVNELAVTRVQGGTAHRITAAQWKRLLQEAGVVVWSTSDSADVGALEQQVDELIRNRGRGQGFGLTAHERSLVERRAMIVAADHFIDHGWQVDDVSATSPYDLRCTLDAEELHVEVKGTTGDSASVILTRGEVIAARATPEAAALALVHGVTLVGEPTSADGGTLRILNPWRPDESALTPIAYRYQVPFTPPGCA